jgi:glycosyltransferase involved in cell wall biosynthesis
MKVAFITRSTLYTVPGGDTEQVIQTSRFLRQMGIEVETFLTTEKIDYTKFDLLHAFNITRPADILYHASTAARPLVVSTILVDYSEYDRYHRAGVPGFLIRLFPSHAYEYIKTIARWLLGKDSLRSKSYLWKGQQKSVREILDRAVMLLPNSMAEYQKLEELYGVKKQYTVIYNGVDESVFLPRKKKDKEPRLVLSAARIEGRKNQLNLIRALNNTPYTLLLTGLPAPNQKKYYEQCRKEAAANITFCGRVSVETLLGYYARAKVHVLPSWHETCGLSTLEAAAMGCNIVITDKGFTREYFGNNAFYCDPGDPASIYRAIESASNCPGSSELQQKILQDFTWRRAAASTADAYKKAISLCEN